MSSNVKLEYSKMVEALVKDPEQIAAEVHGREAALIHMVMGISGEAGELLDAIKKYVIYNKTLDVTNVVEELGDLEFYMEGLRQVLHLDRSAILQANKDKLAVRYAEGKYSNAQARERADKKEVEKDEAEIEEKGHKAESWEDRV